MKKLLVALAFCSTAQAGTDFSVFHDPNRKLNIAEISYFYKVKGFDVYGFNEFYNNGDLGFPKDKNVLFGKTWVMKDVSERWAVGLEIEHGINNAGMYTRDRPFEADKTFILPKIGFRVKLDK
jgi:hypothetical protein